MIRPIIEGTDFTKIALRANKNNTFSEFASSLTSGELRHFLLYYASLVRLGDRIMESLPNTGDTIKVACGSYLVTRTLIKGGEHYYYFKRLNQAGL